MFENLRDLRGIYIYMIICVDMLCPTCQQLIAAAYHCIIMQTPVHVPFFIDFPKGNTNMQTRMSHIVIRIYTGI